ncbi:hypothetical protein EJB05_54647, partial [Eragrostis curvula]
MEAPRLVVGAALRAPPPPPQFRPYRLLQPRSASHFLPFVRRTPLIRCSYSRKGKGNASGKPRRESSSTVRLDVEPNNEQSTNLADVQRKGDITDLFSEAQRNILQLNKQRLVAIEELKKLRDENKSLLQDIQVIETEAQGVLIEAAQSSSFCELLLRIDTMVISGLITTTEASYIRKKVVDNQLTIRRAFSDIHLKPDTELLSELRLFMRKLIEKPLHIVHMCSEMDPVASFGSLSTHIVGLSCALQRNGNLVEVIMPKYTSINKNGVHGLRRSEAEYESYFGGRWHKNRIWTGNMFFTPFFGFSYFSRASLDYIVKSGKQPDILHIHNWETAIVAPLFWDIFAHQCLVEPAKLELCGLDPHKLHRADRLQDPNKTHLVNIMK